MGIVARITRGLNMLVNLYNFQLLRPECVMRVYIDNGSIWAEYFNGKEIKDIFIIGNKGIAKKESNCEKELKYINKKLERQIIKED